MILFSVFEFSHDGYVSFLISSFTVTSTSSRPADPSRIGFVLQLPDTRYESIFDLFEYKQNTVCALDLNNSVLFTFEDLSHDHDQSSFNKSYRVTHPGMYSLFFVSCNGSESLVTMDGRAELYNTGDDGITKNYLSAGLTQLPFRYLIVSFTYLGFLFLWILVCFKNRRSFNRVHLLMSGLLVMNIVQLICAAWDVYHVKVTGTPNVLDDLFCIFQLIRTVLLFTVIVLIFSGWYIWKPILTIIDKLVLIIVILLKVWGNVYSILAWKTGPYNYKDSQDWDYNSHTIDIICCFLIFLPMAISVDSLKGNRVTDGNAALNWAKLTFFGLVVGSYAVFTTIFLLAFYDFVPLVDYLVEEISLLVLCLVMFLFYMPLDENDDNEAVDMEIQYPPV